MTTRRSEDLRVPPVPRQAEAPPPANVRQFPLIVLEMAQRQRERATVKAVARHARRKRLRSSRRPTRGEWDRESEEAGA